MTLPFVRIRSGAACCASNTPAHAIREMHRTIDRVKTIRFIDASRSQLCGFDPRDIRVDTVGDSITTTLIISALLEGWPAVRASHRYRRCSAVLLRSKGPLRASAWSQLRSSVDRGGGGGPRNPRR